VQPPLREFPNAQTYYHIEFIRIKVNNHGSFV
jgi:hypothetical protein